MHHVEYPFLFRGRARVGADHLALGLEDRVDVERDPGVPGCVREEHDAAARSRGQQSQVESRLAAGRVEDGRRRRSGGSLRLPGR